MALTKITTGLVAANTLATANIADNSVDATKIASNSILTRHIDDDQITGDQLADNITIAGNLTITGNLTTNGSTVTNSSSNTTIEDAIIELGTGTSGAPATDAGIVIERGSSDNVFIGWDESADKVTVGTGSFTGASTGNLTITAAPFVSGALTASGISYPTSDGSAGQYLKTDGSGTLSFGAVTTQVDNYTATGNGSTTAFDTGINPQDEVNTWIFIDGVYQQKSQYSYSGSTVTFSTAPENGALIDVVTGTTGGMASSDTVLGIYEATTTNTATYTTGISASNENNTWVFVGGVYQPKDSYTFSSGTLTFDANTPTGQKLSVVATKALTAGSVETTSLGANAVTAVKIASNSILSRHIANNSIVGADISATTGITAATFTGALTGNVTGNVAGNLTGTILTAAQTNITSLGTLSALTVSGQLTAGGIAYPTSDGSADQVLKTDGSGALSFGTVSGTTLNNNTNNYVMTGTGSANTLNGEANLTFDGTTVEINNTGNADSTLLKLKNTPSTAGTYKTGLEFWSNEGTANNQTFNAGRIYTEFDGSNYANTRLTLGSASGSGTFNDELNISNGKVGIGTSSPNDILDIHKANSQLRLTDTDDSKFVQFSYSGGKLLVRNNSTTSTTTQFTLTEDGAFGIGTHIPEGQLEVKGTRTVSGSGAGATFNSTITPTNNNTASIVAVTGTMNAAASLNANSKISGLRINPTFPSSMNGSAHCAGIKIDSFDGKSATIGAGIYAEATTGADTNFAGYFADTDIAVGSANKILGLAFTGDSSAGSAYYVYMSDGNSVTGSIQGGAGNSVNFNTTSDRRLKENIVDASSQLETINNIQVREFDWKYCGHHQVGVIAQELETIVPDAVSVGGEDENKNPYGVDYGKLTPYLIKAIQEQQTIIDDLKSRIETLEE